MKLLVKSCLLHYKLNVKTLKILKILFLKIPPIFLQKNNLENSTQFISLQNLKRMEINPEMEVRRS